MKIVLLVFIIRTLTFYEIQNTKCNDLFLTSYMLSGQQIANNEKVIFCPSIKNSCCSKLD